MQDNDNTENEAYRRVFTKVKRRYQKSRVISNGCICLVLFVFLLGFIYRWSMMLINDLGNTATFLGTSIFIWVLFVCMVQALNIFCSSYIRYRRFVSDYFGVIEGCVQEVAPRKDGWLVEVKHEKYDKVYMYLTESFCPVKQGDSVFVSLVNGIPKSIEEVIPVKSMEEAVPLKNSENKDE